MRIPKPFYRKQTKSWYVQIGRKQINLGKDEAKAKEKYHELMLTRQEPTPQIRVVELLDQYLEWVKQNRSENTYKWYKAYLQPFANHVGGLKVADTKPYHVTSWQATYTTDGNKNCGVRAVKRAFKWATDEGYIDRSPVASCKRPPAYPVMYTFHLSNGSSSSTW